MSLFCYHCQEAAEGQGCRIQGRCGKDEKTGNLQNLLIAWCKYIAASATAMKESGMQSDVVDTFLLNSITMTLTNVNFDAKVIAGQILLADRIRQVAEHLTLPDNLAYKQSLEEEASAPLEPVSEEQLEELIRQGEEYSVELRQQELGATAAGLHELILAGIKGATAYALHAFSLIKRIRIKQNSKIKGLLREQRELSEQIAKAGKETKKNKTQKSSLLRESNELQSQLDNSWVAPQRELLDALWEKLAFLGTNPTDQEVLLQATLEVGEINRKAMALLEKAHLELFGTPEPTVVRLSPTEGKAILVSGHDLDILRDLLDQSTDKGVNIYTHGEMLPAHSYPEFKKYPHLVGHYGGAWHLQQKEFDAFPGAMLMTSNCLQIPGSYRDYIFATFPVGEAHVRQIPTLPNGRRDFSALITAATDSSGYSRTRGNDKMTIGFGADAMIGCYEHLEKAIAQKQLRRFYLIGGCDGRDHSREYFTQLAAMIPRDGAILTLGCAKYRFNREHFTSWTLGLPRLFDMGQCNDAMGAIRLVEHLSKQMGCKPNQLPLSIFLSWYEQKSVAVLLSLLAMGLTNIKIGPTMPAFLTLEVKLLLQERFGLARITQPEDDLIPVK